MKFGMMYEIQIPKPHYPGIEQERYKQVMAQVELADEMGYDYFLDGGAPFLERVLPLLGARSSIWGYLPANQENPYRLCGCALAF